jgi:hypothetical protein
LPLDFSEFGQAFIDRRALRLQLVHAFDNAVQQLPQLRVMLRIDIV